MSEQLLTHHEMCMCESCRRWFFHMNILTPITGRCRKCSRFIDDHGYDEQGKRVCP